MSDQDSPLTTPRSRSGTLEGNPLPCPFLPPANDTYSRIPIEHVLKGIVHTTLGLPDVDIAPYVNVLKENLIANYFTLTRLQPSHIKQLNLPLGLENELILVSTAHREQPATTPTRSKRTARRSTAKETHEKEKTERSALLGLSADMRQLLKDSWAAITTHNPSSAGTPGGSNLNQFFDNFYRTFLEMDKVGRQLFQGVSMIRQAQALMKMMTFVMAAIDNPTRLVIPLKKSGCRHLIYGVERRNFQSFGIALAKTMEQVLGPERCSPTVKEAWFVLIQTLGEIMMEDYDDLRAGYPGRIYKKDGSKWRSYPTLLTHERLVLYKDEQRERVKEEIDLHILDGMDVEVDDLPGRTQKITNHCFSVTSSGTIKTYFCTDTEEELLEWTEDLTERIKAHQRVAQTEALERGADQKSDSSEESGEEKRTSRSFADKASRKVQKLKKMMAK